METIKDNHVKSTVHKLITTVIFLRIVWSISKTTISKNEHDFEALAT